jgi:hypothetical protein
MLQYTKNTVIIMDGYSEAQDVECAILSNESNQGIVLHQSHRAIIWCSGAHNTCKNAFYMRNDGYKFMCYFDLKKTLKLLILGVESQRF